MAAVIALAILPGKALASDCTLSGSGLEGATDTSFYQPATGALKASMIFVDFADHPFAAGESSPQTSIGPALVDWATGYFSGVSGGQIGRAHV